jgi:hypothetical protein
VQNRSIKPFDGFPLCVHPSGKWAKKIRGEFFKFGLWVQHINEKLNRIEGAP